MTVAGSTGGAPELRSALALRKSRTRIEKRKSSAPNESANRARESRTQAKIANRDRPSHGLVGVGCARGGNFGVSDHVGASAVGALVRAARWAAMTGRAIHEWREWARRKPLRLQMWRGPPRREHGAKATVRLALAWRDPRWHRRGVGPGSVRSSGGSLPVVAAGGRTSQGRAPGSPRGPGQGGAGRGKPRHKPRPGARVTPGAEARRRRLELRGGTAVR